MELKLSAASARAIGVQEKLRLMESNGKNHRAWSLGGILDRVLLGRPLANWEGRSREIGIAEGVPALGLDGLSSSAYGPEAALSVLAAAGVAGLAALEPVMLVILALLAILFVSYWQTVKAYPISGGAYTVAKENLGVNASLLASAGIMVDYVLNVAVGISAGVAALISAVRRCIRTRCRFAWASLSY